MRNPHLPSPGYSEQDFIELGRVTAYWSWAESALDVLLMVLSAAAEEKLRPTKRLRLFERKRKKCKEILKAIEPDFPEHCSIGLDLLTVGKLLATKRKAVAHWPSSPDAAGQLTFVDFGSIIEPTTNVSHLTREDVAAIATEIHEWWLDVSRFAMLGLLSGPLKQITTFHGAEQPQQLPDRSRFASLRHVTNPRA